jgi:hypothetical protein
MFTRTHRQDVDDRDCRQHHDSEKADRANNAQNQHEYSFASSASRQSVSGLNLQFTVVGLVTSIAGPALS